MSKRRQAENWKALGMSTRATRDRRKKNKGAPARRDVNVGRAANVQQPRPRRRQTKTTTKTKDEAGADDVEREKGAAEDDGNKRQQWCSLRVRADQRALGPGPRSGRSGEVCVRSHR